MTVPGSGIGALILLIAFALVMTSVPAEAVNSPGGRARTDASCAHGDKSPVQASTGENGTSPHDDCCRNGCHDCVLSCCGGPVCFQTSSAVLDLNLDPSCYVFQLEANSDSDYLAGTFHPPRS